MSRGYLWDSSVVSGEAARTLKNDSADSVCYRQVKYLLAPPSAYNLKARPKIAIALLVVYPILLLLFVVLYVRILQIIITNPGYIAKGKIPEEQGQGTERKEQRVRRSCTITTVPEGEEIAGSGEKASSSRRTSTHESTNILRSILTGAMAAPRGMEQFYKRDAYICDYRGLPIWCAKCLNWKPDRTHHCSEIDRCVRRMDHFCPW